MPTYQYRCSNCGHDLEVVQKFTDPSLTICPECEGSLRKVFNAVGVVFKGSGFYATDSRNSKTASTSTTVTSDSKPAADKAASKPTESKPAESKAATPAASSA